MFHAQGVDLIIEAHEHSYERNWPMYDYDVIQTNYVDPRGSVHVISGAAGNKEGIERMSDAGMISRPLTFGDRGSEGEGGERERE